mmetsp:Transcript_3114/g.5469  ORF Transcript_3114/g.5469 Transcript_3114/m.5469 type:complete len:85 (-) Transcript_3114:52-306(-)
MQGKDIHGDAASVLQKQLRRGFPLEPTNKQEMTMAFECVVQTQTEEASISLPFQFYHTPRITISSLQGEGGGCVDIHCVVFVAE